MRILLDTHTFLWFIAGSSSLGSEARRLIEDIRNEKLISIASLWEIAIKTSLGRLKEVEPFEVLIPEQIESNGFELLNIEVGHVTVVSNLPFHHRDPFDRLLIAQSIVERIPILSADSAFDAYSIERLS